MMNMRKANNTGGDKMKKVIMLMVLCMAGQVMMSGESWSEEGAWYDAAENWIVRAYTSPNGPNYSVTLEVLDTANNLITDPIVGLANSSHLIIDNAGGPDVSLAFDEGSATAYVLYTAPGGGAVSLEELPGIVRARGAMTVTPNPVLFGKVAVGKNLTRTITINNTGNIPVNITSIGTPLAPFSIVAGSTCVAGTPVAVGGNCSIVVRFAPTAVTSYSGSLGIVTSVGNATITLSGSGGSVSPGG